MILNNNNQQLKRSFEASTILVIGDVILDKYLNLSKEKKLELDSPVAKFLNEVSMLGGAANVAINISNLGGKVKLFGVIGDDEEAKAIRKVLKEKKINHHLIVEETRKTTLKSRIIVENKQIIRLDHEDTSKIQAKSELRLINLLRENLENVDGIIISDYCKGVVTSKIIKEITRLSASKNIKVFVDSKNQNLSKFKNCWLIKINRIEAETIVNFKLNSISSIKKATFIIGKQFDCHAIITLDKDGFSYLDGEKVIRHSITSKKFYIKSTIGAGDAFIAGISLAVASGLALNESILIGYKCSLSSIKQPYTVSAFRKDILNAFN